MCETKANEYPNSHITLQELTNSITNKKDSGYGSQGHLKLEVRAERTCLYCSMYVILTYYGIMGYR